MKKRVLVTGACGFIGTHVTKRLIESGHVVHGVDDMTGADYEFFIEELSGYHVRTVPIGVVGVWEHQREGSETADVVIFEGDFAEPKIIRRLAEGFYDAVIHLAAEPRVEYSMDYPVSTYENNLQKTIELFHICAKSDVRVVFASSAAVYGDTGMGIGPVREDMTTNPASPYALQKLQAEQVGSLFSQIYNLSIMSLRFFNVYGPGQKGNSAYSTVIASWVDKIESGKQLRLDGDGEQTRDYVHVFDISKACIAALNSGESCILNIASGRSTSNNNILSMLGGYCNFEVENAPARKGDIKHSLAAVNKAKAKLNFEATVQLEDGIEQLLRLRHGTNE